SPERHIDPLEQPPGPAEPLIGTAEPLIGTPELIIGTTVPGFGGRRQRHEQSGARASAHWHAHDSARETRRSRRLEGARRARRGVGAPRRDAGARRPGGRSGMSRRGLDSGSSSYEHMTAENALVATAACGRGTSNSSKTGSN